VPLGGEAVAVYAGLLFSTVLACASRAEQFVVKCLARCAAFRDNFDA
jgi:hypothetical protein